MINQITVVNDIHYVVAFIRLTFTCVIRCDIHLFRFKCDGCESFIVGTRFHCNECDDFDLCIGCHSFGKFPEK